MNKPHLFLGRGGATTTVNLDMYVPIDERRALLNTISVESFWRIGREKAANLSTS